MTQDMGLKNNVKKLRVEDFDRSRHNESIELAGGYQTADKIRIKKIIAEGNQTASNGFNQPTIGQMRVQQQALTGRLGGSQYSTPIRKPFVSTVTGGESKSRGVGNRLTSTGHGLLFEKRKNKIETAEKVRANTQMKLLAKIDDNEKRQILQNAAKVNMGRTVNVDAYLANVLNKGGAKSSNQVVE